MKMEDLAFLFNLTILGCLDETVYAFQNPIIDSGIFNMPFLSFSIT